MTADVADAPRRMVRLPGDVPPQAVIDAYMARLQALADEVDELFGGDGRATVVVTLHAPSAAIYQGLPHTEFAHGSEGRKPTRWKEVVRAGGYSLSRIDVARPRSLEAE